MSDTICTCNREPEEPHASSCPMRRPLTCQEIEAMRPNKEVIRERSRFGGSSAWGPFPKNRVAGKTPLKGRPLDENGGIQFAAPPPQGGLTSEREAEIRTHNKRDLSWLDILTPDARTRFLDVHALLAELDRVRQQLADAEQERAFILEEDRKRAVVADTAVKAADGAISRLAAAQELVEKWRADAALCGQIAREGLRQQREYEGCADELAAALKGATR